MALDWILYRTALGQLPLSLTYIKILVVFWKLAFLTTAPMFWNSIPMAIQSIPSLQAFQQAAKICWFHVAEEEDILW